MRRQVFIQRTLLNRRRLVVTFLQLYKVFRRRHTADDAIGSIGKWRLVDNRIEYFGFDLRFLFLAPVLRKNMVNIDVLAEKHHLVELLT